MYFIQTLQSSLAMLSNIAWMKENIKRKMSANRVKYSHFEEDFNHQVEGWRFLESGQSAIFLSKSANYVPFQIFTGILHNARTKKRWNAS